MKKKIGKEEKKSLPKDTEKLRKREKENGYELP